MRSPRACRPPGPLLAVAALLLLAPATRGQTDWHAPPLAVPGAGSSLGLHLVRTDPGDLAMAGVWQSAPSPVGLGVRVGLSEGGREAAFFGGLTVVGRIRAATEGAPLDLVWFAGAGLSLDTDGRLTLPAGMALGVPIRAGPVALRPYLAPRLFLFTESESGSGRMPRQEGTDWKGGAAVELGLDVTPSPRLTVRAAASLGDREAVSVGLVFPLR